MPVIRLKLQYDEKFHTIAYAKTLEERQLRVLGEAVTIFNHIFAPENTMLHLIGVVAKEKGEYLEGPFGMGYWLEDGVLMAGPIQKKDRAVLDDEASSVCEWEVSGEKYEVFYWFFSKKTPEEKKIFAEQIEKKYGG